MCHAAVHGAPPGERVVKDICLLSCGRWSAIIREADPGMFAPPGYYLDVTVSCDEDHFARYGICSATRALDENSNDEEQREAFFWYADYLGIAVSAGDIENAHFLVRAADKLSFHILGGGPVKVWCRGFGLKPATEWKTPRDRSRPCSLVITDPDESFILPRKAFFEPKSRAAKCRRPASSIRARP